MGGEPKGSLPYCPQYDHRMAGVLHVRQFDRKDYHTSHSKRGNRCQVSLPPSILQVRPGNRPRHRNLVPYPLPSMAWGHARGLISFRKGLQ